MDGLLKLTSLELVYPPISSQEAVWLEGETEVAELLKQSDFYMIGGREEAIFDDYTPEGGTLWLQIHIGDHIHDRVQIVPWLLPTVQQADPDTIIFDLGPKIIQIWDRPKEQPGAELLDWFTSEKLIRDRSLKLPGVNGLDDYREAATYDLLYVGIARVGDSYSRLIRRGHKTLARILANESQRYPSSRVTDEIYLFMFRLFPLFIQQLHPDGTMLDTAELMARPMTKRIVADAEKAFVSLLRPDYNVERFARYPRGVDGLYGVGIQRYGYQIRDNLTFRTPSGTFRGGRDEVTSMTTDDADAIFVEGEQVWLMPKPS
jgi:hypothetical protein